MNVITIQNDVMKNKIVQEEKNTDIDSKENDQITESKKEDENANANDTKKKSKKNKNKSKNKSKKSKSKSKSKSKHKKGKKSKNETNSDSESGSDEFDAIHNLDINSSINNDSIWPVLDSLTIRKCPLSFLDSSMECLTHIRHLDLSNNYFQEIQHLQECCSLEQLNLSCNLIQSLNDIHLVLGNISVLNLASNRITDDTLIDIGKLKGLLSLNLSYNLIISVDSLDCLNGLPLLEVLWVEKNPFTYMDNYRIESLIVLNQIVIIDGDMREFELDGVLIDENERNSIKQEYETRYGQFPEAKYALTTTATTIGGSSSDSALESIDEGNEKKTDENENGKNIVGNKISRSETPDLIAQQVLSPTSSLNHSLNENDKPARLNTSSVRDDVQVVHTSKSGTKGKEKEQEKDKDSHWKSKLKGKGRKKQKPKKMTKIENAPSMQSKEQDSKQITKAKQTPLSNKVNDMSIDIATSRKLLARINQISQQGTVTSVDSVESKDSKESKDTKESNSNSNTRQNALNQGDLRSYTPVNLNCSNAATVSSINDIEDPDEAETKIDTDNDGNDTKQPDNEQQTKDNARNEDDEEEEDEPLDEFHVKLRQSQSELQKEIENTRNEFESLKNSKGSSWLSELDSKLNERFGQAVVIVRMHTHVIKDEALNRLHNLYNKYNECQIKYREWLLKNERRKSAKIVDNQITHDNVNIYSFRNDYHTSMVTAGNDDNNKLNSDSGGMSESDSNKFKNQIMLEMQDYMRQYIDYVNELGIAGNNLNCTPTMNTNNSSSSLDKKNSNIDTSGNDNNDNCLVSNITHTPMSLQQNIVDKIDQQTKVSLLSNNTMTHQELMSEIKDEIYKEYVLSDNDSSSDDSSDSDTDRKSNKKTKKVSSTDFTTIRHIVNTEFGNKRDKSFEFFVKKHTDVYYNDDYEEQLENTTPPRSKKSKHKKSLAQEIQNAPILDISLTIKYAKLKERLCIEGGSSNQTPNVGGTNTKRGKKSKKNKKGEKLNSYSCMDIFKIQFLQPRPMIKLWFSTSQKIVRYELKNSKDFELFHRKLLAWFKPQELYLMYYAPNSNETDFESPFLRNAENTSPLPPQSTPKDPSQMQPQQTQPIQQIQKLTPTKPLSDIQTQSQPISDHTQLQSIKKSNLTQQIAERQKLQSVHSFIYGNNKQNSISNDGSSFSSLSHSKQPSQRASQFQSPIDNIKLGSNVPRHLGNLSLLNEIDRTTTNKQNQNNTNDNVTDINATNVNTTVNNNNDNDGANNFLFSPNNPVNHMDNELDSELPLFSMDDRMFDDAESISSSKYDASVNTGGTTTANTSDNNLLSPTISTRTSTSQKSKQYRSRRPGSFLGSGSSNSSSGRGSKNGGNSDVRFTKHRQRKRIDSISSSVISDAPSMLKQSNFILSPSGMSVRSFVSANTQQDVNLNDLYPDYLIRFWERYSNGELRDIDKTDEFYDIYFEMRILDARRKRKIEKLLVSKEQQNSRKSNQERSINDLMDEIKLYQQSKIPYSEKNCVILLYDELIIILIPKSSKSTEFPHIACFRQMTDITHIVQGTQQQYFELKFSPFLNIFNTNTNINNNNGNLNDNGNKNNNNHRGSKIQHRKRKPSLDFHSNRDSSRSNSNSRGTSLGLTNTPRYPFLSLRSKTNAKNSFVFITRNGNKTMQFAAKLATITENILNLRQESVNITLSMKTNKMFELSNNEAMIMERIEEELLYDNYSKNGKNTNMNVNINIRFYALLFQPISNCKHQSIFDDLKLQQMYQQVSILHQTQSQNENQTEPYQEQQQLLQYWDDVRKIASSTTGEYLIPRTLIVTSKKLYLVDENYSMWFYKTAKKKASQSWWNFGSYNSGHNVDNRRRNGNNDNSNRNGNRQQFLLISKENISDISDVEMDSNTQESFSIFFGNSALLASDDEEEENNYGVREWKFVSPYPGQSPIIKKLKTEISRIRFAEAVNS